MAVDKPFLNEDEAAELIGVRPQTLALWRSLGRYGLAYIKVGRLVRYRRCDIDRWLESRLVGAEAS